MSLSLYCRACQVTRRWAQREPEVVRNAVELCFNDLFIQNTWSYTQRREAPLGLLSYGSSTCVVMRVKIPLRLLLLLLVLGVQIIVVAVVLLLLAPPPPPPPMLLLLPLLPLLLLLLLLLLLRLLLLPPPPLMFIN
jgi:hypothetical protein